MYTQQARAREALSQIQAQLQQDPCNLDLLQREEASRKHYVESNQSTISLIKQQSKADWIAYGDKCSRVFMVKIKQRNATTSIYAIRNQQDQWVEGFEAVTEVLTDFYKAFLGTKDSYKIPIDQQVIKQRPCLSIEQQHQLCQPFSDSEIKQAIFSIPNHKSPGPDRYNSGFYKASWKSIGPLICLTIKEIFSTGELPSFYGETKLVILPKVQNPERAKDFRPLSCCNVIYKCITKILCSRLKEVLPLIINPFQGAFLKGRELLFNVRLC